MKFRYYIALTLTLTVFFCGCTPTETTSESTYNSESYFTIHIGEQAAELQLALNDSERSKGLMHRESLELACR